MGSGMASLKQFLLSLLATSVSIALTFGTAAIIDYKSKQKAKREIVMMVMYDMYNTIQTVEEADSMLRLSVETQRQIAEDTTKFKQMQYELAHLIPRVEYTETAERIFSTNIETINTVGNVLFTEIVAEFYQQRNTYKTVICDSIMNRFSNEKPLTTLKSTLDFEYTFEAIISHSFLQEMKYKFDQCKQMMDVSDEEIEIYQKERRQIDRDAPNLKETDSLIIGEMIKVQEIINDAREKIK